MKVACFRDFRSLALLAAGRYPYPFLPQRARGALVDLAAAVETRVRPNRRRRIVRRLGATFRGDLPKHRIQNVARLAMRHETGEDISAWVVADAAAGLGVETEGLRHLQDALDRGKGVILWESPIGRRLLAKVALVARGFDICQVHGPDHWSSPTWLGQTIVRRMTRSVESRLFSELIDLDGDNLSPIRRLLDRLRQNRIVCLSGAGGGGRKFVPVEFFGVTSYFATGAISLAKATGAAIIPIFCVTREDGTDQLALEPPIEIGNGMARDAVMIDAISQYVRLPERYIREYPEQWSLWHTLPAVEAS